MPAAQADSGLWHESGDMIRSFPLVDAPLHRCQRGWRWPDGINGGQQSVRRQQFERLDAAG